jgi:DNA-binding GntR family transcriptional regulator
MNSNEFAYLGGFMSRAQDIYDAVIEKLRKGEYRHGDRVRAEDVAQEFGVSRTPVREALSRLQERGLLEMAPSGLAVVQLTRQRVLEIYAIREILEGSAARFAAQHASPSDIFTMKKQAEAFADASSDPEQLALLNRRLHDTIYEASHNRYLITMLNGLHDSLMLLPSTTFAVSGRQTDAVEEHRAIVEAIESRDPDLSEKLAREHIRRAQETRIGMMFDY